MAIALKNFNEAVALRDSFEVIYERRLQEGTTDTYDYKRDLSLVYHYEVATISTGKSIKSLMLNATITNPKVSLGSNSTTNKSKYVQYTGTWDVERITVEDRGNRGSVITVSLIKRGNWYSEILTQAQLDALEKNSDQVDDMDLTDASTTA